jgi:hypothetical protein
MAKPKTAAKSKRPAKTKAPSKPARAAKTKAPRTPPRAAKTKPEPEKVARTWQLALLFPSGAYIEKHYQAAGSVDSPEEVADLYRDEHKLPDEVRVALILDESE